MHSHLRAPRCCLPHCLTPSAPRFLRFRTSLLRDTQPTYAPVQRFKCGVTAALAWLGVRMVATPFLYDSFFHYFTPVYPDAIQAEACPTIAGKRVAGVGHALACRAPIFSSPSQSQGAVVTSRGPKRWCIPPCPRVVCRESSNRSWRYPRRHNCRLWRTFPIAPAV